MKELVEAARKAVAALPVAEALERIKPAFAELLADPRWLPEPFRHIGDVGPQGQIASWLLFRSAARDLCLFSLAIPAGVSSPIHDHRTWGLVGLYAGAQEEVYQQPAPGASLVLTVRRRLQVGEFYPLLPPEEDIHRVTTLSECASVSLHLLGNDTGCSWRTIYQLDGSTRPFRSGWYNRPCDPHGRSPPTRPG